MILFFKKFSYALLSEICVHESIKARTWVLISGIFRPPLFTSFVAVFLILWQFWTVFHSKQSGYGLFCLLFAEDRSQNYQGQGARSTDDSVLSKWVTSAWQPFQACAALRDLECNGVIIVIMIMMDSWYIYTVQIFCRTNTLCASTHHSRTPLQVDVQIIFCHRNRLHRFVKKTCLKRKRGAGFWTPTEWGYFADLQAANSRQMGRQNWTSAYQKFSDYILEFSKASHLRIGGYLKFDIVIFKYL